MDGEAIAGAVLTEGTSFVPLRSLLERLGYTVQWEQSSRTARAQKQSRSITVREGEGALQVDGVHHTLPAAGYIDQGTFYIPLRALCTALGATVDWNGKTRSVSVRTRPDAAYSQEELYWLARIIYAESGAEPLEGQIAVGNVVLNRVRSPEFPNDIYSVIFDARHAIQFEPVGNGTIYNTPSQMSYTAARMALEGHSVVGDCLYFFSPSLSPGSWIVQNRSYYTTIGCHRFYL